LSPYLVKERTLNNSTNLAT